MARTMRSHKGSFYVKGRSLIKTDNDGDYHAVWAKLLPSNMIVSKYWIKFTMHGHDDVTVDSIEPMEFSLDGYMMNIPSTSSLQSTSGGGTAVAHIDSSDDLGTTLAQLGVKPSVYSPYVSSSSDDNLNVRNGVKPHQFWQDRQFFSRSKTLSFPNNTIMVNGDSYRYYETFSTNGTKLGQNTDYKQPRVLQFYFTADTTKTVNQGVQNSTMLVGASQDTHDIDINEWDRQAQTAFDPSFVIQGINGVNDYLDSVGSLDGYNNPFEGTTSTNVQLEADADSTYWSVRDWLRQGYINSTDDDVDAEPANTNLLIDMDVTLQCQMYDPAHRYTVTTP